MIAYAAGMLRAMPAGPRALGTTDKPERHSVPAFTWTPLAMAG